MRSVAGRGPPPGQCCALPGRGDPRQPNCLIFCRKSKEAYRKLCLALLGGCLQHRGAAKCSIIVQGAACPCGVVQHGLA